MLYEVKGRFLNSLVYLSRRSTPTPFPYFGPNTYFVDTETVNSFCVFMEDSDLLYLSGANLINLRRKTPRTSQRKNP